MIRRLVAVLGWVSVAALVVAASSTLASAARFTSPRVGRITVRVGKPFRECDSNGKNCNPWHYRAVTVSFVARANLAPGVSWYEFTLSYTPTGSCFVDQGGQGGPASPWTLRAGQRTASTFDLPDCPRIVHGAIVYDTSTAPHTNQYVPHVGYIDGVLVGTFSFRMS